VVIFIDYVLGECRRGLRLQVKVNDIPE